MALKKEVYQALEDIVGPENISEEPAVLDSYAHSWGEEYIVGPDFRWMPRFEAVLLPGNTQEVQAIVKVCNRWRIKLKAHSVGYGPFMCSLKEGCIGLDMRRMNRILEINEKGMYAVIEPYVTGAQLHAELMKRGLATGMIGPGANTSAFPIVPASGEGWPENAYANTHRNQLGLEWVLPTGEVLRTGSLGAGAGWFCSEGPGPSVRGLAAGAGAAMGGVGVFTKAGVKLYHWPGPKLLPVAGLSPSYYLKEQPRFGFWFFTVPSYEKAADAGNKIGQSEIAIILQKGMGWKIAADSGRNMDEVLANFREISAQMKGRVGGWIVLIGADTEKEFRYKQKVLMQIVKDVDGELLPFLEDNPDVKARFLSRWTRCSSCDRECRRVGGGRLSAFMTQDSIDHQMNVAKVSTELKKELIKARRIWDDGGDQALGNFGEHGRVGHVEQIAMAHATDEGFAALRDYGQKSVKLMSDPKYKITGYPPLGWTMAERQLLDDAYVNWATKIKKVIDPHNVSESSFYTSG
jgi:glycolate oxidase